MKLNSEVVSVLKLFASVNTNIVIHKGNNFSTISPAKDIIAMYEGDVEFDNSLGIYNLNELLGVISAFPNSEIDLDAKFLTVKDGKQKVKYVYADESLLSVPTKEQIEKLETAISSAEVSFVLSADHLARIQKMSGVLAVEDLTFIGDGKNIVARVHDVKNSTGNNFDIDLESATGEKFSVDMKVSKLKLFSGHDYDVKISSKKLSKFSAKGIKLETFVAVESSSTFN